MWGNVSSFSKGSSLFHTEMRPNWNTSGSVSKDLSFKKVENSPVKVWTSPLCGHNAQQLDIQHVLQREAVLRLRLPLF